MSEPKNGEKKNANDNGYATNVDLRKGDIDKVSPFKEIYRILKNAPGRMMISDLITDKEVDKDSVDQKI
jgi:hypothetical protein